MTNVLRNFTRGAVTVQQPNEDRRYREITAALDRLAEQAPALSQRVNTVGAEVARLEEVLIIARKSGSSRLVEHLTALDAARAELAQALKALSTHNTECERLTQLRATIEQGIKREQAATLIESYRQAIRVLDANLSATADAIQHAETIASQIESVLGTATGSDAAAILGMPVDALYLTSQWRSVRDSEQAPARRHWRERAGAYGLLADA